MSTSKNENVVAFEDSYEMPDIEDLVPKETDEEVVARLAKLTELDYERTKTTEAKAMGIKKISVLDKLVDAKRAETTQTTIATSLVEDIEPWPIPVDADDLLQTMVGALDTYIILPKGASVALSLWSLASYGIDTWSLFPKVLISSPDKRCGKSTLLELMEVFAHRAMMASNISASAIFRCIELYKPTLILDEADTFMKGNPEMNGILNAGHKKRHAFTVRNEVVDKKYTPTKFNVWCPQIIAGIGRQQGTLHDRSICINMKRKTNGETVSKLPNDAYEQGVELRSKCMRWTADNGLSMVANKPHVPACGNDRTQDNWQPLFDIAQAGGGDWLKKVEEAYFSLNMADNNAPISLGEELLADVKTIFEAQPEKHMFSIDIVTQLVALEGRPWADMGNGVELNQNRMAKMLKEYDCHTHDVRIDGGVKKGYGAIALTDAFKRYLKL